MGYLHESIFDILSAQEPALTQLTPDVTGHFQHLPAAAVLAGDLLIDAQRVLRVADDPQEQQVHVHFPVQVWREGWIFFGSWSLPRETQVLLLRPHASPRPKRDHEQLLAEAREWIGQHPRASIEDLLAALQARPSEAAVLRANCTLKSAADNAHDRRATAERAMHRIFELLRQPLSAASYEQHRRGDEPSSTQVAESFGSWTAACAMASVPMGHGPRIASARWGDEELLALIKQYAQQTSAPTARGFERWLGARGKRAPMLSVITSRLGSWPLVLRKAYGLSSGS